MAYKIGLGATFCRWIEEFMELRSLKASEREPDLQRWMSWDGVER